MSEKFKKFDFPEVILGLGGAGKNLVFSMLEKEWLVRNLLKESERSGKRYSFVVVDTAYGELPNDEERMKAISSKISKISKELGIYSEPISLKVKCITKYINVSKAEQFYGRSLLEELHANEHIKAWWIYDKDKGIDNREIIKRYSDFSKGTLRVRGVTKAMFYKALVESNIDEIFEIPPGSLNIAMIVGLGGGTGSGIFIDLAKYIHDRNPGIKIDLFGILPSTNEGDSEKINTYIALTELEYLRLRKGLDEYDLFKSVILTTIDPTGYEGTSDATKADFASELKDFSDVFPYIIRNYYEGGMGNLIDPDESGFYRGFILASGGIVSYDIKRLYEIKNLVREYVGKLNEYVSLKSSVQDKIREKLIDLLIKENFIDLENDGDIYKELFDELKNELVIEIYDFIEKEYFNTANYKSPKAILEGLKEYGITKEYIYSIEHPREFKDCIERINSALDMLSVDYSDASDRMIVEILRTKTNNILELYDNLNMLDNFKIPDELPDTLKNRSNELTMVLLKLAKMKKDGRSSIQKLLEYIRYMESENETLNKKIKKIKGDKSEIQNKIDEKEKIVSDLIKSNQSKLQKYYNTYNTIKSNSNTYNRAITSILNDLSKIHSILTKSYNGEYECSESISNEVNGLFKDLASLRNIIRSLHQDEIDYELTQKLEDIIKYLEYLKEVTHAQSQWNYWRYKLDNAGFVYKLTGKKKTYEEESERYKKLCKQYSKRLYECNCGISDYIIIRQSADHSISIVLTDKEQIAPVFKKALINILDNLEHEIIDSIMNELNIELDIKLKSLIDDSTTSHIEFINSVNNTIFEEILRHDGLYDEKIKIDNKLNELQQHKKYIEKSIGVLKQLYEVVELLVRSINNLHGTLNECKSLENNIGRKLKISELENRRETTYIKTVQPDPRVFSMLKDDENIGLSTILNSQFNIEREIQIISKSVDEITRRIISPQYLGYNKSEYIVNTVEPPETWSFEKVIFSINSEAVGELCDKCSIDKMISENIKNILKPEDKRNNVVKSVESNPWDIALVCMVPHMFLENIRVMSKSTTNSCYKTYAKLKNKNESKLLLHHVYKFEEGWYLERDIMNIYDAVIYANREIRNEDIAKELSKTKYKKKYLYNITEGENNEE